MHKPAWNCASSATTEDPADRRGRRDRRALATDHAGYCAAEATQRAIQATGFLTGDAGYLATRLSLHLRPGEDLIVSGGEEHLSGEVESALFGHPAVAMCRDRLPTSAGARPSRPSS